MPHRNRILTTRAPRDFILRRTLAVGDMAGILAAAATMVALSAGRFDWETLFWVSLTVPAWLLVFSLYRLYERDVKRVSVSVLDDLPALFHALVVGTLGLWAYFHVLSLPNLRFVDVAIFGAAALVYISVARLLARKLIIRTRGPARALFLGESSLTEALVRKMRGHPEYGLEPVGRVAVNAADTDGLPLPLLGRLDEVDLQSLVRSNKIERVFITAEDLEDEQMLKLIYECGGSAKVSILPRHVDALGPSVEVDDIEGVTVLGLNPLVLSRSSRALKRTMDVVGSAVGLFFLAPVMLLIAAAIKLDSPGPVLFRQSRIGRSGRPFTLTKFRTMVTGAEAQARVLRSRSADPNWLMLDRDPRVTRVGRLLRLASLDELPQLWSVLKGDMSLVGPRPLISQEDGQIEGWARTRLDLAPGLTGLWQVLGRTRIPFEEMVKLDCAYVSNWSLWLDVKLIMRTIPAVVTRRGAN